MMPGTYKDLNGNTKSMDLDSVLEFIGGVSGKRPAWRATVVLVSEHSAFVELRDSPADVRGNSASEAEEVTRQYLIENYAIDTGQIETFMNNPAAWKFIDRK